MDEFCTMGHVQYATFVTSEGSRSKASSLARASRRHTSVARDARDRARRAPDDVSTRRSPARRAPFAAYPSRALVAAFLVVAHLALVEASGKKTPAPPASPSIAAYPIPLPADARCPLTSDGVVPAARANPLVRAVVQRTRMAAPFGPSWPRPFVVPSEDDEPRFGWRGAIILVADVRVDPERAAKWLPRSIMDTTSDVARVFVRGACVRDERCRPFRASERAGKKKPGWDSQLTSRLHLHPLPSLSLFQGIRSRRVSGRGSR